MLTRLGYRRGHNPRRSTRWQFKQLDMFKPKARGQYARELGKRYLAGEEDILPRLAAFPRNSAGVSDFIRPLISTPRLPKSWMSHPTLILSTFLHTQRMGVNAKKNGPMRKHATVRIGR